MPNRVAPWVFISYAHDTPAHKRDVLQLAEFLRARIGLDVHLDRWYDDLRRDWSIWATEQLTKADFVLIIASPGYRRRAEGTARPDEGRGGQFEAAIIRDLLTRNLAAQTLRMLPVVLPGRSVDDIPAFLSPYSTTRFHVDELTEAGVADLLGAITGRGPTPMPSRGEWRGGAVDDSAQQQSLLAALPWRVRSPGAHRGVALIEGVRYDESIVVRRPASAGRCFVEVDLGRNHRLLETVVGVLDDAVEPFQAGCFRLCLDGRPQLEIRATRGNPRELEVDVTGVRRLLLEMWRPAPGATPVGPRSRVRDRVSGRLPELAWGNPILR